MRAVSTHPHTSSPSPPQPPAQRRRVLATAWPCTLVHSALPAAALRRSSDGAWDASSSSRRCCRLDGPQTTRHASNNKVRCALAAASGCQLGLPWASYAPPPPGYHCTSTRRIAIRPLATSWRVLLFARLLFFRNGVPSGLGVVQMTAAVNHSTVMALHVLDTGRPVQPWPRHPAACATIKSGSTCVQPHNLASALRPAETCWNRTFCDVMDMQHRVLYNLSSSNKSRRHSSVHDPQF
jgi:hypothetical protein